MPNEREIDPYAAPHAPKERSGPILRVGLMVAMLAAAAAGWSYFSAQPHTPMGGQTAQQEELAPNQPIQVADAGAASVPEAIPAPSAIPQIAPAAAPRREAAPRAAPAAEPAPAPVASVPAPTTTVEPLAPAPVQQM